MQLTHKIKLNPTVRQQTQLAKTAGCARYAYNWGLAKWEELYKQGEKPNRNLISRLWTKEKPDWAKETSFKAQQRAILDLGAAYANFFNKKAGRPKFKKKGHKDAFYCANDCIRWFNKTRRASIPVIGRVRVSELPRFMGKIMGYRVTREANDWYICVNIETDNELPSTQAPATKVGIDVGLSHVATASDGAVLDLPEKLKQLDVRKRRQQRALARSQRNSVVGKDGKKHKEYSKNGQKKLLKLQKIQQKINNIRKDACHKWTTMVCKSHATVVIETLDIKGMQDKAPKTLRSALATSMMSEVHRQLKYKAKTIIEAPQYFPSSKRCSQCGHRKEDLKLSDRTYTCAYCGLSIDRDMNASLNLMQTPWVTRKVPVEQQQALLPL